MTVTGCWPLLTLSAEWLKWCPGLQHLDGLQMPLTCDWINLNLLLAAECNSLLFPRQFSWPKNWTKILERDQDPRQTDWLWKQREQNRQKERTNNYRKLQNIMGNGGASLSNPYVLQDHNQVEKFLEFGEFELTERDIARIKAEKEREMRVSIRSQN